MEGAADDGMGGKEVCALRQTGQCVPPAHPPRGALLVLAPAAAVWREPGGAVHRDRAAGGCGAGRRVAGGPDTARRACFGTGCRELQGGAGGRRRRWDPCFEAVLCSVATCRPLRVVGAWPPPCCLPPPCLLPLQDPESKVYWHYLVSAQGVAFGLAGWERWLEASDRFPLGAVTAGRATSAPAPAHLPQHPALLCRYRTRQVGAAQSRPRAAQRFPDAALRPAVLRCAVLCFAGGSALPPPRVLCSVTEQTSRECGASRCTLLCTSPLCNQVLASMRQHVAADLIAHQSVQSRSKAGATPAHGLAAGRRVPAAMAL